MPFEKCRYCGAVYHFRPHDIWQWVQVNGEKLNRGELAWGVCISCHKQGLRNDDHLPPEEESPSDPPAK